MALRITDMKFSTFIAIFFLALSSSLLRAQDELTITATHLTAGKAAAYDMSFTATDDISPDATIHIVFPKDFDVSQVVMAASKTITGGFTVSTAADTVRIKRTGLGTSVPRGTACDLAMAAVTNAPQMDTEFEFVLAVYEGNRLVFSHSVLSRIEQRLR